jgi:hypothetical protein
MLLYKLLFLIFLTLFACAVPFDSQPTHSQLIVLQPADPHRTLSEPGNQVSQNFLNLSWLLMIRIVARGMNSMVRGTGPTCQCSGALSKETTPQLLSRSKRTLRIIREGLGMVVGKKLYHGEPQAPWDRTASTLARIRMMVL